MAQSLYTQFRNSRYFRAPTQKVQLRLNGGLNLEEDQRLLPDSVVVNAYNVVADALGRLRGRPGVTAVTGMPVAYGTGTVIKALGYAADITSAARFLVFGIIDTTNTPTVLSLFISNGNTITRGWSDFTSPSVGMPAAVITYNGTHYFPMPGGKMATSTSTPNGFGVISATLLTIPTAAIEEAFIIKDRMILVDPAGTIYWSKATDPATWSTPDGGSVKTGSTANEYIQSCCVYQDSLWLGKSNTLWRFSWTSDPGIDGAYEAVIQTEGMILDIDAVGQELYVLTTTGLYRYTGGFLQEMSRPVAPILKPWMKPRTYSNTNFGLNRGTGIHPLTDRLLLIGPIGDKNRVVTKGTATIVTPTNVIQQDGIGHYYLVFNIATGIWTEWQFNANDYGKPIAGPNRDPAQDPTSTSLLWIGLNNFAAGNNSVRQQLYSIDSQSLDFSDNASPSMYDTSTGGSVWIGQKITSKIFDFGSPFLWKRLKKFFSMLDMYYGNLQTFPTFSAGGAFFKFYTYTSLLVSAVKTYTYDISRLKTFTSFRFQSLQMEFDSLTNSVASGGTALPIFDEFELDVVLSSRESTT